MNTTGECNQTSEASEAEEREAQARRAHATAVKLLGPRDHSRQELRRKLLKRDFDAELCDSTLDALESLGYLDDSRFAERYAEQRSEAGYGPLSIRAKLMERGVDNSLVSAAIAGLGVSWDVVAAEALERKFTADELVDADERIRGRIARFLQTRGFSTGDALSAVKQVRQAAAR